mmetsp:Transcript_77644/g.90553  ORF Transcript_77644/g.90553 Transcript_77644/m.90553 type:complete len:277 (-) Transcript_77644:1612-2442(-)
MLWIFSSSSAVSLVSIEDVNIHMSGNFALASQFALEFVGISDFGDLGWFSDHEGVVSTGVHLHWALILKEFGLSWNEDLLFASNAQSAVGVVSDYIESVSLFALSLSNNNSVVGACASSDDLGAFEESNYLWCVEVIFVVMSKLTVLVNTPSVQFATACDSNSMLSLCVNVNDIFFFQSLDLSESCHGCSDVVAKSEFTSSFLTSTHNDVLSFLSEKNHREVLCSNDLNVLFLVEICDLSESLNASYLVARFIIDTKLSVLVASSSKYEVFSSNKH